MAAALLYTFNGLAFSGEIAQYLKQTGEQGALLIGVIIAASMVIVGIFGWLVSYATNFILNCRNRELGIYILSGMKNKQVAQLFYMENLVAGAGSFVLGIVLGNLLSQLLRAIVLTLFELPYTFSLSFSLPAMGMTLVYFSLIFLLALDRTYRHIRNIKIYDLLYLDRQNQGAPIASVRGRRWIFVVSIFIGIFGIFLLMSASRFQGSDDLNKGFLLILAGSACMIIFLYGFFLGFASAVPEYFEKHSVQKYRKQNLLVFRTLTARLKTMGTTMATVSLLFTATLVSFGTGLVMYGMFTKDITDSICFDLSVSFSALDTSSAKYNENLPEYQKIIQKTVNQLEQEFPVERKLLYPLYANNNQQLHEYIEKTANPAFFEDTGTAPDLLMRYSDYAALRSLAGYKTVPLPEGKYLIHCIPYLRPRLEHYKETVLAGNQRLAYGGIYSEAFHLLWNSNGEDLLLVVPDEAVDSCLTDRLSYAAKTKNPVEYEPFYRLCSELYTSAEADSGTLLCITSKNAKMEDAALHITLLVFPLCFFALALTMTAATILTLHQLDEAKRSKKQFELLHKLGMSRHEMIKTLRKQSFLYYSMPAVPPVIVSVPLILHRFAAWSISIETMTGFFQPSIIIAISLGLVFAIYAVYIILAYCSMKRNILPEQD